MRRYVTREQARDFADAHAQGLHDGAKREFCPDCDGRDLKSYPRSADVERELKRTTWLGSV